MGSDSLAAVAAPVPISHEKGDIRREVRVGGEEDFPVDDVHD